MKSFELPYDPYDFMLEILLAPERFLAIEAHRRCSKTMFAVYWLILQICNCKSWHPRGAFIGPTLENAYNAAWDYLLHFTAHLPGIKINRSRLTVHFPNGGQIKLYGATDPDKVKGTYLDAVVSDESAQHPPKMWQEVLRPMLNDRGREPGRALFIGTTKGKSWFWELTQREHTDPEWKTWRFPADKTGVFTLKQLEEFRREMGDALFNQEFMLDPHASIVGAFLGAELQRARDDGRITRVPYDPQYPVHLGFDLGVGSNLVIWFMQSTRYEDRFIDYHEGNEGGITGLHNMIRAKNYAIGELWLPHDAPNREKASNMSYDSQWQKLGYRVRSLNRTTIGSRIAAAKAYMSRCAFDAVKCERGLDHLANFKVHYDERLGIESNRIDKRGGHDHAFDAFSHIALSVPDSVRPYTLSELDSLRMRDRSAIMSVNY